MNKAMMVAKALSGGISGLAGAFDGAAKPFGGGGLFTPKKKEAFSDETKKTDADETKESAVKAFDAGNIANIGKALNPISDKRLKEIYGESISDRIIDDFAKIAAIDFKYKPEAQKEYADNHGVDDKEHTGVIAQELAQTKSTESTVSPDENGNLSVDTQQLTMTNTAAIAELSRRVLTLETAIKELMSKGE